MPLGAFKSGEPAVTHFASPWAQQALSFGLLPLLGGVTRYAELMNETTFFFRCKAVH